MTAVHASPVSSSEFETISRAVEHTTDSVQLEYVGGRLGFKYAPDGNQNRNLNWLLTLLMPLSPQFFLHQGQGLQVGSYRKGRARPDGVVAPLDAFVGRGAWAPADQVSMVVEVTSHDSDTNQRDRLEKPRAYAASSIPVYLLIDREKTEVVVYSEPVDGEYQEARHYSFGRPVQLPGPIGITLDTSALQEWVD
jgi:Uma2 family endonuclease